MHLPIYMYVSARFNPLTRAFEKIVEIKRKLQNVADLKISVTNYLEPFD